MRNVSWAAIVTLLGAVGVGACGSTASDGSFGNNQEAPGGENGSGDQGGFGGSTQDEGGSTSSSSGGPGCAATSTTAQLTQVNLVVMLDASGSMGDTTESPSYDPALRWDPVVLAMEAFFNDPGSVGMSAALTIFPRPQQPPAAANSCTASDYENADIGLAPLPTMAFAQHIGVPPGDRKIAPWGDTPTLAAVNGAIQQAKGINTAHPDGKAVIVLVTDGEPVTCARTTTGRGCNCNTKPDNNQLAESVTAIKAVASTIPTYVVGVGPSVNNLTQLATAGGTTFFPVSVASKPEDTSAALRGALDTIRGKVASCDFDIPNPPDGRTLDFNKVNVAYTPPGGSAQTLPYSADCSTPNSWHFDNPAAQKKVLLCPDTCNTVRLTQNGQVDVVFACVDRPDVVK